MQSSSNTIDAASPFGKKTSISWPFFVPLGIKCEGILNTPADSSTSWSFKCNSIAFLDFFRTRFRFSRYKTEIIRCSMPSFSLLKFFVEGHLMTRFFPFSPNKLVPFFISIRNSSPSSNPSGICTRTPLPPWQSKSITFATGNETWSVVLPLDCFVSPWFFASFEFWPLPVDVIIFSITPVYIRFLHFFFFISFSEGHGYTK